MKKRIRKRKEEKRRREKKRTNKNIPCVNYAVVVRVQIEKNLFRKAWSGTSFYLFIFIEKCNIYNMLFNIHLKIQTIHIYK